MPKQTAPKKQMMSDEEVDSLVEEFDSFPLKGGLGKGAGPISIETGIPLMSDENFCRSRCLCYDGGCIKFDVSKFQWLCIKLEL